VIRSIADLPFAEGEPRAVLGIGDRATIDAEYTGFGWTRVERIWLADPAGARAVDDALVLALHAADDGPARADDVLLEFALPGQPITVWLSAFLARWRPRLPAARATVLALCNPHRAVLTAPAGVHHALGAVDSWLDLDPARGPAGERLRLVAEAWRQVPPAPASLEAP
jgi:hypothetical protein